MIWALLTACSPSPQPEAYPESPCVGRPLAASDGAGEALIAYYREKCHQDVCAPFEPVPWHRSEYLPVGRVAWSEDVVCVRESSGPRFVECASLPERHFSFEAVDRSVLPLHLCAVPHAPSPVSCAELAADAASVALSGASLREVPTPVASFGVPSADTQGRVRGNLDDRIACVSDGNQVECARRGTGEVVGFCGGALDPGDDPHELE